MTRKQKRGALLFAAITVIGVAAILVLFALKDAVTYFHPPSDVAAGKVKTGQRFRLGGLVETGTLKRGAGTSVTFNVTDTLKAVPVAFTGVLPDLFREGQGVVTEGKLDASGVFVADAVLAKHDETYMPPEVAKALKDKGVKLGGEAVHPKAGVPMQPAKTGG